MAEVLILREADLRRCVPLDGAAVDCVERAFAALASETVAMPPVLRLDIPIHRGEIDVKTAWVPTLDSFAVKLSPGFFDNPALGLPSLNGLMVVLSARTGMLQALLLDNGYLTAVRTAAAGAVAARHLARADAQRAAVLGAGMQARLQLQALCLVRPIRAARIWAPQAGQARDCASQLAEQLGIDVLAADSIDAAVAEADVVVTTSPSEVPLLEPRHLRTGMHVTAMGSDAGHKNEIAPQAVAAATRYVCDRLAQVRLLGELHHAIEAGCVAPGAVFPELGQVIAGLQPGRGAPDDTTLCDLTGTGVQDTAIAVHALACAQRAGLGTPFDN